MEPFEKLKDRLDDALEQIEYSLDTKIQNRENIDSLETLITANSDLKRQIDVLKDELENSTKNENEQTDFQSLNAELVKKAVRVLENVLTGSTKNTRQSN